jgi:2-keto-3-deoxy-L-rhamnonate aldolase RhmA
MRHSGTVVAAACALAWAAGPTNAQQAVPKTDRLNPLIALHEAGKPVFGLYAPSAGGGRGRGGSPPPPAKTPGYRAAETMDYKLSDFIFDGSMERSVDGGLAGFAEYAGALRRAGANVHTHPLTAKTAKISDDPELAKREIARQLDTGVSGIVFVDIESADELRTGLNAMRFAAHGGTRPHAVGSAPSYWGLSEGDYRARADLWPLNVEGELVSWVIVESHEGLANVREIAAVPGIAVLFPGAGTLRGLFTSTNADGERVLDTQGWENAIQKVLAACKEFDVPCGYPANASDIELRMQQGFSVFIMGWGQPGFDAIEIGRKAAGR